MKNKLKAKDLIVAGAFAAMYIVLLMITVSFMGFIPVLYLFVPLVVGIICGPVYMLYTMKIQKPGAVLILAIILSMVLAHGAIYVILWIILCGIVAEVFLWLGKYKSKSMATISFSIFACSTVGPFLILAVSKSTFLQMCLEYYGQDYVNKLDALTPSWIIFLLIGFGLVGGLLGATLGKRLLRKHFEKAGVV